jgi:holo-[acyl-carrier protein] synthase
MIAGIGTDLVECARLAALWARFGERVAARLLAPAERAAFRASRDPARFLAKAFAAKEAFAKATGSGLREPVSLTRMALLRDAWGKPYFECAPPLAAWLAARGIGTHHVSLSDEGGYVLAFVVLERST